MFLIYYRQVITSYLKYSICYSICIKSNFVNKFWYLSCLALIVTPNATYIFDRGYLDYKEYDRYCKEDIFFITRLKKNAVMEVLSINLVSDESPVLSDKEVILGGIYTALILFCLLKLMHILVGTNHNFLKMVRLIAGGLWNTVAYLKGSLPAVKPPGPKLKRFNWKREYVDFYIQCMFGKVSSY